MLVQCWSTVYDAGPIFNKHWLGISVVSMGRCFLRVEKSICLRQGGIPGSNRDKNTFSIFFTLIRWPNIRPTFDQRLVLLGCFSVVTSLNVERRCAFPTVIRMGGGGLNYSTSRIDPLPGMYCTLLCTQHPGNHGDKLSSS